MQRDRFGWSTSVFHSHSLRIRLHKRKAGRASLEPCPLLHSTHRVQLEGKPEAVLDFPVTVDYDTCCGQASARLHRGDQVVGCAARLVQAADSSATIDGANRGAVSIGREVWMIKEVENV